MEREKKGKRERQAEAQETETGEMAWATSQIEPMQLKSVGLSDVLGHGILNISGHVSAVQQKAINFFGIFSTSLRLGVFKWVENFQDKNISCLRNSS